MSRTGFRIREYVLPARYLEGVGVSDEVNDGRLVDSIFTFFLSPFTLLVLRTFSNVDEDRSFN